MNNVTDEHAALDEQALRWLSKQQQSLTGQEQQQFSTWLQQDNHAARYQAMEQLWLTLGQLPDHHVAHLRQYLPTAKQKKRSYGRGLWLVATAVLLVILAWPTWLVLAPPLMTTSVQTGRGELKQLTLPDGTRLNLDAETQLQVTYYRHARELTLSKGQVFFEVQHQADKPFVVLSGPSRVTVLGTSFSVRYVPASMSGEGIDVAVSSGRVRVGPRAWLQNTWWRAMAVLDLLPTEQHLMVLQASQRVISDAGGNLTRQHPVAADSIANWRQSRVTFDNTPLNLALAEFARYGDMPYRITSTNIGAMRISGSFNVQRLDSFMRELPKILPIKLKAQSNETQILVR